MIRLDTFKKIVYIHHNVRVFPFTKIIDLLWDESDVCGFDEAFVNYVAWSVKL